MRIRRLPFPRSCRDPMHRAPGPGAKRRHACGWSGAFSRIARSTRFPPWCRPCARADLFDLALQTGLAAETALAYGNGLRGNAEVTALRRSGETQPPTNIVTGETLSMNIDVRLSQLDELKDSIDALARKIVEADNKIDKLAPVAAVSAPVQMVLPLTEKPVADAPGVKPLAASTKPKSRKRAQPAKANCNGAAAEQDDEDTLRARAMFESKRVQRAFGVGGMRAVIRKVAGDSILQIDDVPLQHLPQLIDELRAM